MKRTFPYPLLLIAACILDQVVTWIAYIDLKQGLRPLFVALCLGTLITLGVQHFVKDWHRTNFKIFVLVMLFVIYPPIYRMMISYQLEHSDYLGIALILLLGLLYAVIVSRKFWQYIRQPAWVTYYLSLVCTFLMIFQIARLGADFYVQSSVTTGANAIPSLADEIHLKSSTRPDIYVIILDAYGREDVLQSIYGYDNSEFIHELEKRGFYVPTKNHSNYIQTPYAMASLWNFDYLQSPTVSSNYRQYLIQSIQNNRAFQLLHEIGYTTVSFAGATDYTEIEKADVYLTNFLPLNRLETLLLANGPLEPLSNIFDLGIPVPTYKTKRLRTLYKFDELKNFPDSIPSPKLVYAHFILPHPPFMFDRNGNTIPQKQPYRIFDDSESAGGEVEYQHDYREAIMFANGKVLEAIDGILAKSKTPPIILLMGDHGPASMFQFGFDHPGCLRERTGNLYALRLPDHQNDDTLYQTISPVNTFRVIFNTYFGTKLPLLEDRTYLAALQYPDKIKDITNSRDSFAGCTISGD
jgi:hypothetical protein